MSRYTKTIAILAVGTTATLVYAGFNYANIKATVECSLDGSLLDVDAGWVATGDVDNDPLPVFSHQTVILEKRVGRKWVDVATLMDEDLPDLADPLDLTDVNLCESDISGTNSLRVVLILEVANANPKRKGGLDHLARCISFPPPSCE